jgi:hypothetical protein
MGQHHTFGITGRARGVQEYRGLVRAIGLDRFRHRRFVQRAIAERTQCVESDNVGAMALGVLAMSDTSMV